MKSTCRSILLASVVGYATICGISTKVLAESGVNKPVQESPRQPASQGERAPDFALPAENGKTVHLSDFQGKKLVVFFYGTEASPATAKEASEIQKYYSKFKLADVDVLGVGPDPVASHKALATNLDLKYHLLTDKADSTRKLFKLSAEKGRYGVVINERGVIKKIIGGETYPKLDYVADTYDFIMSTQGSGF